jgi:hypothetical protein
LTNQEAMMADQTVASLSAQNWSATALVINPAERAVLRDLAARVAELAARPIEKEKRELWYRHNALQSVRPLVFCDPENGWNEIITPENLLCQGELARHWEMILRKEIYWGAEMKDDRVISGSFDVPYVYSESDWGLHETYTKEETLGSYVWDAPVKDFAADLPRLRFPEITVDHDATNRLLDLAREVVGDFLEVRLRGIWWWTLGMTWTLVKLRGLTQIMIDMLDEPDQLHRAMAFLRDGHLARLDFLERNGLLPLNNDGTYVGSGGFGWSRELPQPDFAGLVRTQDMWGFCESQETVGVSPAMFAEFVFPYQLPILERFGLNCYGCCEPLDKRWRIISKIPNLRRVSVSAWADVPKMAEQLGNRYVFSWKPRPADLASEHFDEPAIREYVRGTLRATRDCVAEIIMKDNHTIGHDPRRVVRWVEIVREEIDRL